MAAITINQIYWPNFVLPGDTIRTWIPNFPGRFSWQVFTAKQMCSPLRNVAGLSAAVWWSRTCASTVGEKTSWDRADQTREDQLKATRQRLRTRWGRRLPTRVREYDAHTTLLELFLRNWRCLDLCNRDANLIDVIGKRDTCEVPRVRCERWQSDSLGGPGAACWAPCSPLRNFPQERGGYSFIEQVELPLHIVNIREVSKKHHRCMLKAVYTYIQY